MKLVITRKKATKRMGIDFGVSLLCKKEKSLLSSLISVSDKYKESQRESERESVVING